MINIDDRDVSYSGIASNLKTSCTVVAAYVIVQVATVFGWTALGTKSLSDYSATRIPLVCHYNIREIFVPNCDC